MSKYNNKKTIVDGIKFDSKKEANRYLELKLMQRAGKITDLQLQVPFILQEAFIDCNGKREMAIKYYADFVYYANGKKIVEDAKGVKTSVYKLKKKLFKKNYNLDITEI